MDRRNFIIKWIILPLFAILLSGTRGRSLQLRTIYGSTTTCKYITGDIFAVWWDKNYDYSAGAAVVLNSLIETRKICRSIFKMKDPKGSDTYYYNVYIHNNGPDLFPDDWAQAQSTDDEGFPFLTIPAKLTTKDFHGYVHEGFHIFQYNSNSPGFKYEGDSQWFIEASANWFVNIRYPGDVSGFLCGEAVTAIPHVPMWYSFENKKPGDKSSWLRDDHQYGMNCYLYYLTEVCKVPRKLIAHGFYDQSAYSPQEYLYRNIGAVNMRKYYADWAIHSTAGFDYLSKKQVARLRTEFQHYGDSGDNHSVIKTFDDLGTNGWITVRDDLAPAAWAYNVYKINNTITGSYTVRIKGDNYGSAGTASKFSLRAAVHKNNNAYDFHSTTLPDDKNGSMTITVTPEDSEIWIVVASMPDDFSSNQTYSYQININADKEKP